MRTKTFSIILFLLLVVAGLWIYQLNRQLRSETQKGLNVIWQQTNFEEKIKKCLASDKQAANPTEETLRFYKQQTGHEMIKIDAGARYYLLVTCVENAVK